MKKCSKCNETISLTFRDLLSGKSKMPAQVTAESIARGLCLACDKRAQGIPRYAGARVRSLERKQERKKYHDKRKKQDLGFYH